jgi:2-oxoglutarate dehydrogenase E2 component (dihydrolipoamide succinyltransferase)
MSRFEFKMPKLGESITEATIIAWFKNVGDTIEQDEMLLEVSTDKVDSEVPSTVSGIIEDILFSVNDVIKIGDTIAIIKIDGKASVSTKKSKNKTNVTSSAVERSQKEKRQVKPKSVSASFSTSNTNTFFSPLIIAIAKEHHISFEELARIPATGNDGRLRKSDVMQYINDDRPYKFTQPIQDPTAFRIPQLKFDLGKGKMVKMDKMRKMISDHMVYSKHTSPHVTAFVEADLTDMVNWRNKSKVAFQEKYNVKLTFTPLFIEAVAKAIKDFPNINASVDDDTIIVKEDINIGMATALPSGNLIVPVVKNADKKRLGQLAENVNALVEKARKNNLNVDDIKGGTFTISNVGTFGSLMGTPIINQPEVAILAMGIIKKRPEVITTKKGDEIAIRSMMYLSLSFDHRAVDGYLGGSFLRCVADYLEQFDIKRKI